MDGTFGQRMLDFEMLLLKAGRYLEEARRIMAARR
jgi:hypothetical protein